MHDRPRCDDDGGQHFVSGALVATLLAAVMWLAIAWAVS